MLVNKRGRVQLHHYCFCDGDDDNDDGDESDDEDADADNDEDIEDSLQNSTLLIKFQVNNSKSINYNNNLSIYIKAKYTTKLFGK